MALWHTPSFGSTILSGQKHEVAVGSFFFWFFVMRFCLPSQTRKFSFKCPLKWFRTKKIFIKIYIFGVVWCCCCCCLARGCLFSLIVLMRREKQATRAVGMKSVTKCYACKRRRQKIHFHVVHVNLLDTPGEGRRMGLWMWIWMGGVPTAPAVWMMDFVAARPFHHRFVLAPCRMQLACFLSMYLQDTLTPLTHQHTHTLD